MSFTPIRFTIRKKSGALSRQPIEHLVADFDLGNIQEYLPSMSSSEYAFPDHLRIRAAEIVAEIADSKSDPVADYLFVKLSQEQNSDDLIDL